jgi:hypothetical protein
MRISKLSLIVSVAGALTLQLHAQQASPEQQNKALELLRQTLAREQTAQQPVAPTKPTAPAKAASTQNSATPGKPAPATASKKSSSASKPTSTSSEPKVTAAPTQPAPQTALEQPTGPKTKQQRLADLLELYKADKISPAEYHAQRAKILAEP